MDIGYSICKCYFRLVTFYFITYYYKTGGMLGVIGLKLSVRDCWLLHWEGQGWVKGRSYK